jgi:hypothetical protein
MEGVVTKPPPPGRFEPLGLPLWSWNEDFRAWIRAYESWLPLEEPSHLASAEVGQRIIEASDRTIGSIVQILRQAAVKAPSIQTTSARVNQRRNVTTQVREPSPTSISAEATEKHL